MSLILCLLNQLTVSFVWGTRVAIKTALSAMKVDIPHWLVVALRRRAMISAVRFHIPCRIRAYGIYYEWIWNMNIYIYESCLAYGILCCYSIMNEYVWFLNWYLKQSSNSFCVSTSQKAQQSDSRWCRIWQPNLQSLVSLIRVVLLVGKVVVA